MHRLEMLNWGTFNGRTWSLSAEGLNTLVTGDIGSGKSTIIDAIVTLLVSPKQIEYNKAAGSKKKERDRLSYVLGQFMNRQNEIDNRAKPVYLRKDDTYTVLLAEFYNEGYLTHITLAQVMWVVNNEVKRFYVVSSSDMTIRADFVNFGSDIFALKKRLKGTPHTEVFDEFPAYCSKFRSLLGLHNDKALDLFNQTVSMKSIESLNDFVRRHMIEPANAAEKIGELVRSYEDLNRIYESAQRAKAQIQILEPLCEEAIAYDLVLAEIDDYRVHRHLLPAWIAMIEAQIKRHEEAGLLKDLDSTRLEVESIINDLGDKRKSETSISTEIANSRAGREITSINDLIEDLERDRKQKKEVSDRFLPICVLLGFKKPESQDELSQILESAKKLKADIAEERLNQEQMRDDINHRGRLLLDRKNATDNELTSLKTRTNASNIPFDNLGIRKRLVDALNLNEDDLPFVGELIKVKSGEKVWEGAIERVLRSLGLSVLVPEKHYAAVSAYVNQTDLKGKLVYFKVTKDIRKNIRIPEDALYNKIDIKEDCGFEVWLHNELAEHQDYICCVRIEQFQRERKAITEQGQIKSGAYLHIKDDRKSISDRSRYILGWSNLSKIKVLEQQLSGQEKELASLIKAGSKIKDDLRNLESRDRDIDDLSKVTKYADINWQKVADEIVEWQQEAQRIKEGSEQLSRLQKSIDRLRREITEAEKLKSEKEKKLGGLQSSIEAVQQRLKECDEVAASFKEEEKLQYLPKLRELYLKDFVPDSKSIRSFENTTRQEIEKVLEQKEKNKDRMTNLMLGKMGTFKKEYPSEALEVDISVESRHSFKEIYRKIKDDDLPRYEEKFKAMLNTGVIRNVVHFRQTLQDEVKQIKIKIDRINESLQSINYNEGTFIELLCQPCNDPEIGAFREQLKRSCENTLGSGEEYGEESFQRVKVIIDRFRSPNDPDKTWTEKVTDVRNWVDFAARERRAEDGSERDFYSDSSGKSGGQKEKLAYTILASALAYQFGLDYGNRKSRCFRFVVIDEAFHKGSDESTKYALELFKQLDLQLLIVTPLQKLNIIENYVESVNFIDIEDNKHSKITPFTIEEYRQIKERLLTAAMLA